MITIFAVRESIWRPSSHNSTGRHRTNPNAEILSKDVQAAASTLGLQIHVLQARSDGDLTAAFDSLGQLGAGGLLIGPDPFFNTRAAQLAALTISHAVPTIYQYTEFASAGGLMS